MRNNTCDANLGFPGGGIRRGGKLRNTARMVMIMLFTIVLCELLRRIGIGPQSLILIYMLSVLVVSSVTPSPVYGFVAAIVSTFTYDFFITEPRLGFSFYVGFPITLITMLMATFITGTLTMNMQTQARLAREREHRAQLLYEMNQKLLAARDRGTIVELTLEHLISHLGRPAVFYTRDPNESSGGDYARASEGDGDTGVFSSPEERKRVHRIFALGHTDPVELIDGQDHLVYYEPVISKGKVLGVIGISNREGPLNNGNQTFVQMLTGQVALALELQNMSDEQSSIMVESEREKMRGTLLRSISHDLRTPLTSILGASSTLLEQKELADETRVSLVMDIRENAEWLIRMVENILTVTRISKDTRKVRKTLEAAEEVVAQTVAIVRKRFPRCLIHVRTPDELLMVPMDATLISQVLINLLENSVRNSEPGALILLDLRKQCGYARFDVSDSGRGIPEHMLDNLFEINPTAPAPVEVVDTARGMGIGLSICRTIIAAHGGTIEGHNRKEGGAKFFFLLPLQEGEQLDE